MTHDPLCPDPDYPLPRKCVNCHLIDDVREDMIEKSHEPCGECCEVDAVAALRALQEKP
jgi:hypothetical protein